MQDDEPPDDEQLDSYLAHKRRSGMQVDYDPVEVTPPSTNAQTGGAAGMRRAVIDGHFV